MVLQILHFPLTYIAILVLSIGGLAAIDYIKKIALFDNPSATLKTLGIMIAVFLGIDIVGIHKSIFSTNQDYVSGVFVYSPDLPIEEFFFLTLLCYSTLVLYIVLSRYISGKQRRARANES